MDKEEFKNEEVEKTQDTQPETNEGTEKEEEMIPKSKVNEIVEERVGSVLKREREQQEKLLAEAEREKKQAEELAKLSEKERAEKELELREQDFERRQQEFERERLELETTKQLDKRDLPVSFAKYVIGEDAETTQERINEFEGLWEKELERRRVDAMRGTTPAKGEQPGFKNPFSDEHFNLTEQGRLNREEPEKAIALQKQAKK